MRATIVKVLHRGYNSRLNKYVAFVQVRVNGSYRYARVFRCSEREIYSVDVGNVVDIP